MNTEPTFHPKRQLASLAVLLVLIAATYYYLHNHVMTIDAQMLWHLLRQVKPGYIALSIFLLLMYILVEGRCFAVIMSSLDHRIGAVRATVYSCADLYFSAITPAASGGQPSVVYYMVKDGISFSKASTVLLLNTIEYIASLVIMGLVVCIIDPALVLSGGHLLLVLFVIGMILNVLLIIGCLFCMVFQKPVRSLALLLIGLLCNLHIYHDKQAKVESLDKHLEDYKNCVSIISKNRLMLLRVFILNTVLRLCLFAIAYSVYLSFGVTGCSFFQVIALQIISAVSVNSLPIPGAVGAAEGVFLSLYARIYPKNILMPAMLLTRGISYYLCFILCGAVSLVNHVHMIKKLRGNQSSC